MRLICPNCDAEYEVDPSVIPEAGRDVQCSNCGNTWFQTSPSRELAIAEEADLFDAPPKEHDTAAPPETKPRGLDETVVAVLREEAEREAAARRAEAGQPIETQTELGLSAVPVPPPASAAGPATPAARHIAKMKGLDPDPRPVPRPQTRRDMLPAIDEINSTLRATSEKRSGEPAAVSDSLPAPTPRANSFRNGFFLVVILAAIGLFTYLMAPRIGEQIPGLAPTMSAFVTTVDAGRIWLDGMMQGAIAALRGLTGDGQT